MQFDKVRYLIWQKTFNSVVAAFTAQVPVSLRPSIVDAIMVDYQTVVSITKRARNKDNTRKSFIDIVLRNFKLEWSILSVAERKLLCKNTEVALYKHKRRTNPTQSFKSKPQGQRYTFSAQSENFSR